MMGRRRWVVLPMFLLLASCTGGALRPLDPIWGKEACGNCAMLVSESAPAAQIQRGDGSRLYFDDIGCFALWLDEREGDADAMWVRGPGDSGWVDARTTRYLTGQRTPMDFGFLAATEGISLADLRQRMRARGGAHQVGDGEEARR